MPLYDFKCLKCGSRQERLFPSFNAMQQQQDLTLFCPRRSCTGFMARQITAPSSVIVTGFNKVNGYASPRTMTHKRGSVTTKVSGNFEAFSEGLV